MDNCKHHGATTIKPDGKLYCLLCKKKLRIKNIADLVKEFAK